ESLDVDRIADEAGHALRSAQQVTAPDGPPADGVAAPAAFCATCWGQRQIWEPGSLGFVPVICDECRGRGYLTASPTAS
ncbi:MAG: hypothetical protein QOK40_1817, partial [Miltoncostaeaceae bacterium]|nr:hypothetical protein [Miltoncostaeaceae bacterium]